jgi:hypothetical protein
MEWRRQWRLRICATATTKTRIRPVQRAYGAYHERLLTLLGADGHRIGSEALVASRQALVIKAKGSVQTSKSIDFVPGIPLTPVGKPDKKAVRAQYWKDSDRRVG